MRAERLGVLADQVLARRTVDAERDDLTVVGGDDVAVLPDDLREPLRDQLADSADAASMSSSLIVPKLRSIT